MYSIAEINEVVSGKLLQADHAAPVEQLVYDSRNISFPNTSLFFALHTEHGNGHLYIEDAYRKGIRHFVIDEQVNKLSLPGASVLLVADTLKALQALAAFHRGHYHFPVIGITGSNGKTIVKEWLNELLQEDHTIVRSPRSYNSQIGVPLSVWQMSKEHTLGIFEAGISELGEMKALAEIIKPDIVVLTNIGAAHDAGFTSREEKIAEKLMLAGGAKVLICKKEMLEEYGGQTLLNRMDLPPAALFLWGKEDATISITRQQNAATTILNARYNEQDFEVTIPFADEASVENAIQCLCVLLYLGYSNEQVQAGFLKLRPMDMRLQLKHAANHCLLINDSYSADITSLKIALDFLELQNVRLKRTVILSEFFGSSNEAALYQSIADLLIQYKIEKAILIGETIIHQLEPLIKKQAAVQSYSSTDDFLTAVKTSGFLSEIILLKGARSFHFERIAQAFDEKVHQTVLEVNLNALAHNLKAYQGSLRDSVKVMAMVKAFSYGSGGAEIASVLQFNNVDYLGVAYADEGIALRKNGIRVPIMVMNAEEHTFSSIVDYNLQPVIYSTTMLERFQDYLLSQGVTNYPVHLEVETGMNRLGFSLNEIEQVKGLLLRQSLIKIESVFSHLAASEDPSQDDFTKHQADLFLQFVDELRPVIPYPFLRHIANSAAIIRHPSLQLDMVRLGIGLYGIETATHELNLEPVATLKSTIAQLKNVNKGESVSYNRRGVVQRDSLIATVRIGYADGYWRRYGNGVGKMYVNGMLAPVIGTVCMDMTMIDVTDIHGVAEGVEVIIFGKPLPVQEVAGWAGTIPYELMTGVSQRVKRIYYQE